MAPARMIIVIPNTVFGTMRSRQRRRVGSAGMGPVSCSSAVGRTSVVAIRPRLLPRWARLVLACGAPGGQASQVRLWPQPDGWLSTRRVAAGRHGGWWEEPEPGEVAFSNRVGRLGARRGSGGAARRVVGGRDRRSRVVS